MASSTDLDNDQNFLKRCIRLISPAATLVHFVLNEIHFIEMLYIRLYNIYAFVSQMFFFLSCALAFDEFRENEKREEFALIGLKTLLFYSVFTYFVTKTRDIVSSNRPSMFQNWNITEGLCRIVIEWAKAIVVVVCLREQGIYFKPSISYAFLTFTYYLCTEKIFTEIFVIAIQYFAFEIFDDMEYLYIPLALNIYTTTLSIFIHLYLLTTKFVTFALISFYFTIYIRSKDLYYNYWKIIKLSQKTFENFRNANQKEIDDYDDICAVCLNKMSKAKITPCNHFFHPRCLKECLKNSFFCPLCKLAFE